MTSDGEPSDDAEDSDVGYRRPPKTARFTKGRSGNPAGRPRGRHREAPYEAVLGQMVTIREGGTERRVTAAEAFLLQLAKRGVEGDGAAARASLAVLDEASKRPSPSDQLIISWAGRAGSVTPALEPLRFDGRNGGANIRSLKCALPQSNRLSQPEPAASQRPRSNNVLILTPSWSMHGLIIRIFARQFVRSLATGGIGGWD